MKRTLLAIAVFVIVSITAGASIFNVADLNRDGIVDLGDLAILAENWMERTIFDEPDIEFVFIPAGTFLMGDESGGGGAHERPRHTVNLAAFELSKYEVTNYQYSRFLNTARVQGLIKVVDGVVYAAADTENAYPHFDTTVANPSSNISYGESTFGVIIRDGQNMSDHPVTIVSWYGAKAFCEFYGWRLPTEAEWEYAARGGYDDPYAMYPWGSNTIHAGLCNYDGNVPAPRTTPVGRYSVYGYGLCDMAGNVFEWCSDWYADDYYASSPIDNPPGPDAGVLRILRGGYYRTNANGCRVAFRYKNPPATRSYLGFRPARDTEFVSIPGGTFLMGDESGEGGYNEHPRHTVTVEAFELSKYEVSNYQYSLYLNTARIEGLIKVVDGVVYAATDTENARPHFTTTTADPASNISYGELIFGVITRDGQNMSDHPVTIVSWYGAKAFCEFYGWRLPTEAEWEHAARKGYDEYYAMYPWGDNTINASLCNYNGNVPVPRTTPVGRYPAYGYGLCDMAGNVFEWCSDWYADDYYASSPIDNPPGPDAGVLRILRGGYYRTNASGCRVAFRYKNTPVTRSYLGFRPARNIERNQ